MLLAQSDACSVASSPNLARLHVTLHSDATLDRLVVVLAVYADACLYITSHFKTADCSLIVIRSTRTVGAAARLHVALHLQAASDCLIVVGTARAVKAATSLDVASYSNAACDGLVMVVVAASFYTSFGLHVSSPFWFAALAMKTQLTARLSH